MLSAVVCSGHEWGFIFTGFVAWTIDMLHSSYIFVYCLPVLLAIVECLFAPTPPTLSYLHHVTLVLKYLGW